MPEFFRTVTARLHDSGFALSDSNFNSLSVLSNGRVYYTLSSHSIDHHGRVFCYEPDTDTVHLVGDLGEIVGEAGKKTIPQGKSHSPFFEAGGKLYFATHYGYYQGNQGKEEPAPPPEGYFPYPGGKLIAYDQAAGSFEVLAAAPPEQGIITMQMDTCRLRLFCITWPHGLLLVYDVALKSLRNVGPVFRGGEIGLGDNYFCICRAFAIDPRDGLAYFTNPDGTIYCYDADKDTLRAVEWAHMRKDVFGSLHPHIGGHQGYNWRYIIWNEKYQKFYGVHGKSGYLFSFDPAARELKVLERICSAHCRENGLYEYFRYGHMTLTQRPGDPGTLYYISSFYDMENPSPAQRRLLQQEGSPAERAGQDSYLSVITYRIPDGTYRDHGVLRLEDGRYPGNTQTLGMHPDGRLYTCAWIPTGEKKPDGTPRCDCQLISFSL